jgi:formiminoglutamase
MNWENRYVPPDPLSWQGRDDLPTGACFFQQIRLQNLLIQPPEKTAPITFALLGFKCDEGVQRDLGRSGASEGPTSIRHRLAKLPMQKSNIHCYDVGNITCLDHDLEASQLALAEVVNLLIQHHVRPIVIGGGHELAFGQYLGIAKTISPQKKLGIINFDPHFDIHPLHPSNRGSTNTVFYQIAKEHSDTHRQFDYNCIGIQHAGNIRDSFELAKQFNVKYMLADHLHQGLQEKCFDFTDRIIDENDFVYMSLSCDVISPAFAPGVSAIQPLGLSPWHIIPLIRQIAGSTKAISYDISEYVPRYDIDHRTAKLAAILIYEIIHHHKENSKSF